MAVYDPRYAAYGGYGEYGICPPRRCLESRDRLHGVQLKTYECKRGNDGHYGYEPGKDAHWAARGITVDYGCKRVGYEGVCGQQVDAALAFGYAVEAYNQNYCHEAEQAGRP